MRVDLDRDIAQHMIKIIDMCATRGAFKGEELFLIGSIRANILDSLNRYFPDKNDEKIETKNAK